MGNKVNTIELILESDMYEKQLEPFYYTIGKHRMKTPRGEFTLDKNNVIKMREANECNFPSVTKHLYHIPPIDSSFDNCLYTTTTDGDKGDIAVTGAFKGEIIEFRSKVVAKLASPSGLLIRDFRHNHVNCLLDEASFKSTQFQIDYLHLGAEKMTFIEVGLSKDRKRPNSTIKNKLLTQCLQKTIPQALMLLYSFYINQTPDQKFNKEEFLKLIDTHLKVLLVIPNVSLNQFREYLGLPNENATTFHEQLLENKNYFKYLLICLSDNLPSAGRCLLKLNDHLGIQDSNTTIDDIFKFSDHKKANYFTSLLSLVALNVFDDVDEEKSLDVDERYHPDLSHWLKSRPKHPQHYANFNICLSPQQYTLL